MEQTLKHLNFNLNIVNTVVSANHMTNKNMTKKCVCKHQHSTQLAALLTELISSYSKQQLGTSPSYCNCPAILFDYAAVSEDAAVAQINRTKKR